MKWQTPYHAPRFSSVFRRVVTVYLREGVAGLWLRLRHKIRKGWPQWSRHSWVRRYTPGPKELEGMRAESFRFRPVISVVMPVYNPKVEFLEAALESVCKQVYPQWQLCIADDCSTNKEVHQVLQRYQTRDKRIDVVWREENGHIAAASNSALEIARGEFIVLLDHDDCLAPHALYEIVRALNDNPGWDLLYSNEDKIDSSGKRFEPTFKAGWDPDYFHSFMYIGHLSAYRRSIVTQVGGFRVGFEGSQDYDLALRVTERTDQVGHIPKILYHWRKHSVSVAHSLDAKPYAIVAAERALGDAMCRQGMCQGRVECSWPCFGFYRIKVPLRSQPLVALVGAGATFEWQATGGYQACELVSGVATLNCESEKGVREIFKHALANSSAEYFVYLPPGLVPEGKNWLENLLEVAQYRSAGLVGGMLIDRADRVLSAGLLIHAGQITHGFFGYHRTDPGYAGRLACTRRVSALASPGCLIHRSVLEGSGSLDEAIDDTSAFSIALGLASWRLQKVVLWTPEVVFKWHGIPWKRKANLGHNGRDQVLGKCFGVAGYRDPFYPEGLDRKTVDYQIEW